MKSVLEPAGPSLIQSADPDNAVSVRGLSKVYRLYGHPRERIKQALFSLFGFSYGKEFHALKNISFDIRRGEILGIIGRNGSGKSTLLQILAGVLPLSGGVVNVRGRVMALLELGSGFNPHFTGRENVFLNGALLGLGRGEIEVRMNDILSFADIGHFVDQPVKTYSSGMQVRLAFAVQACLSPEILIVDEALAVGDAAFQRKCFRRLMELHEKGATIILVSHDLNAITNLCTHVLLLEAGEIIQQGNSRDVCNAFQKLLFGETVVGPAVDYGDGGAMFEDVWFENTSDERVSSLTSGGDFFFCYTVRFKGPAANPIFGMAVKNIQGILLSSTNTYLMKKPSGAFVSGQEMTVKWRIGLPLTAGYYFFSCGCSYEAEDRFLCRRVDALKLLVTGGFSNAGLLDVVRDVSMGPGVEEVAS